MIFVAAIGAVLASFAGWFAYEIYRAPLVPNDPPDLVFLPEPDVVIDRLEAEMLDKNRLAVEAQTQRDEARLSLKLSESAQVVFRDRALAAEQRVAFLVAEAHGWQPRLAKAEAERDVCRESVRSSGEFWLERVKDAEKERDEQRSLSHEHYEAYISEVSERQAAEAEKATAVDIMRAALGRADASESRVAALEEALREGMVFARMIAEGNGLGPSFEWPRPEAEAVRLVMAAALADEGRNTP